MKLAKLIILSSAFMFQYASANTAPPQVPEALDIEGQLLYKSDLSEDVISNVQLDLSERTFNKKELDALLNSNTDFSLQNLAEAAPAQVGAFRTCVNLSSETPIYNLPVGEFRVIRQYNTSCSSGVHSIRVSKTGGGYGLLRAYVLKHNGSRWVQRAGGGSSASYTGSAGSYVLVVSNEGINTVSGRAKTSQAL